MIENEIRDRLVEQGEKLFNEPKPQLIKFTNKTEADKLLNDLDNHPHAFVLGCIMNRQV
jgi:hypothetical protein